MLGQHESLTYSYGTFSLQSGPLRLKKKLVIMLVINIFQVSWHSQVAEYGIHSFECFIIFIRCDKALGSALQSGCTLLYCERCCCTASYSTVLWTVCMPLAGWHWEEQWVGGGPSSSAVRHQEEAGGLWATCSTETRRMRRHFCTQITTGVENNWGRFLVLSVNQPVS